MSFTTITDSFNRANDAANPGSTDGGQTLPWTVLGTGTWGIQNNQLYHPTDGASNNDAVVVDSGVADCTITFKIVTTSSARICFRATDVSNYFILDIGAAAIDIYKREAGSYGGSLANAAVTVNANDLVSVVLSGANISVKVNAVQQIAPFSNAFNQTATKHGAAAAGLGPVFDDLQITVP